MSADRPSRRAREFAQIHPCEIAAALVLGLYYFLLMRFVPPTGDESWYLAIVPMLDQLASQSIAFELEAAFRTLNMIVDRGWYMPGMSLIIWPVTWFTPSIEPLRIYAALLNFALLCGILNVLRDLYGARAQMVFLGCLFVLPYYWMYSFLIWGDLIGSQTLLLICLLLIRATRNAEGRGLSIRTGLLFGGALGLLTYVRGFYWLALPLLLVGVFFSSRTIREETSVSNRLRHLLIVGGATCGLFFLVLSPWSFLVSQKFGFHLTTTSLPVSQIVAFGSHDYVNSTKLRAGISVFDHLHDYIVKRSQETGSSFRTQAREELALATAEATWTHYARVVVNNSQAYFLDSETFIERFRRTSASSPGLPSSETRDDIYAVLKWINHSSWRIGLGIGLLFFVFPIGAQREKDYLSTYFKYVVFLFTLQPLTVFTHGRYYVQYVAFLAAAIAISTTHGRRLLTFRSMTAHDAEASATLDDWIIRAGQIIAIVFAGVLLSTAFALLWIFPADG